MFRSFLSTVIRAPSAINRLALNNTAAIRCFSDSVNSGTVKWFDLKKGFGFIVPDDGTEDIFVHQTAVHAEGFRSLAEGEPVEFSTMEDPSNGKIKAQNVTGPMGAYVQGAPRDSGGGGYGNDGFGGGGGNFGGGGGGGNYGGDGF